MIQKSVVKRIAFFLEYEQDFLKSFEKRFTAIYMHRDNTRELGRIYNNSKEQFSFGERRRIKNKLRDIEKESISVLKTLKDYPDREVERILEEDAALVRALGKDNYFFRKDLIEFVQEAHKNEVKNDSGRVKDLLLNLKLEGKLDLEINEHCNYLEELFRRWRVILIGLRGDVERLESLVAQLKEAINSKEEFGKGLIRLQRLEQNILFELKRERNEFIIPISSYFQKDLQFHQKLKAIVLKRENLLLNEKMIRNDLKQFSSPIEVKDYLELISRLIQRRIMRSTVLLGKSAGKNRKLAKERVRYYEGLARFVQRISNHASIKLYSELANTSFKLYKGPRDQLTGLALRAEYTRNAPAFIKRAIRESRFIGVLFFDIDKFKSFNDTYDHAIGDEALRAVSHIIRSEIRSEDQFYRWGGEELVVVLPLVKRKSTISNFAERVRKEVEEGTVEIMNRINSISRFSHLSPNTRIKNITVSGGIAYFKGDETDRPTDKQITKLQEELIQEADERVYDAKNSGRNKICESEKVLTISDFAK